MAVALQKENSVKFRIIWMSLENPPNFLMFDNPIPLPYPPSLQIQVKLVCV